jgi:hypothetical protein
MKKRVLLASIVMGLAIVLLAAGGYAADATHDPGIQKRFVNQQKRIDNGIASRQLTQEEAAIVQDNLNRIMADEAQLKAAGKLTPKEKARIEQKLDLNSEMIIREKHNAIRRLD